MAYDRVLKRHRSAYDAARLVAQKAVFLEARLKAEIERSRLEIARLHAHRLDVDRGGKAAVPTHLDAVVSQRRRGLRTLEIELKATRQSTRQALERVLEYGSRLRALEMERLANLSCLERRALLDQLEADAASRPAGRRDGMAGDETADEGDGGCDAEALGIDDGEDARALATVRRAAEEARAHDALEAELAQLKLSDRARLVQNEAARLDHGLFDM